MVSVKDIRSTYETKVSNQATPLRDTDSLSVYLQKNNNGDFRQPPPVVIQVLIPWNESTDWETHECALGLCWRLKAWREHIVMP